MAIVQSNYIQWKSYFDLIDRVDEFICMMICNTRRDWRNRNKIKTALSKMDNCSGQWHSPGKSMKHCGQPGLDGGALEQD